MSKSAIYYSKLDKTYLTQPRSIAFVIIDDFALMSFASAVEPLRAANLLSSSQLYNIHYLTPDDTSAVSSGINVINATDSLDTNRLFDLVLVVAGGNPSEFSDSKVLHFIRQQAANNVLIGAISGGAFILAKAGIMDNRRMTIHWDHIPLMEELYPYLLLERSIYVKDRNRITSAGGVAPLDMMHALISEHHGQGFAQKISDWFLHTEIRPSHGPQRSGLVERYATHNRVVLTAIEAMQNHLGKTLSRDELAFIAAKSPRQLERLFKQHFNQSPMQFYLQLRLEKAQQLLAHSTLSITDIALATGFANPSHFTTKFHGAFDITPSKFRRNIDA